MKNLSKILVGLLLLTSVALSEDSTLERAHRVMADKLYSEGSPPLVEIAAKKGHSQAETEAALKALFDGFAQCSIDFMAARPEPEFLTVLELTAQNASQEEFVEALGPWVETMRTILDAHKPQIIDCAEKIRKDWSIQLDGR